MSTFAARLEVIAGKAAGMSILVEDELLIGRHADGAGRLAEDEEISRSHARVTLDASGFCAIEDLGSTNGTFVNGLRITSPQTLSEGDTIELGSTTLIVRDVPVPSASIPPSPSLGRDSATPAHRDTVVPSPVTPGAEPPSEVAAALDDEEDAVEPPVPFGLRLEVDFDAHEARIALDDVAEPIRLVYDAGTWRPAPAPDTEP